jgi:hypothetical protein
VPALGAAPFIRCSKMNTMGVLIRVSNSASHSISIFHKIQFIATAINLQ